MDQAEAKRTSVQRWWLVAILVFLLGESFAWAQYAQLDSARTARTRRLLTSPEALRLRADTGRSVREGRFRVSPTVRHPQDVIWVHLEADPRVVQIGEPVRFILSPAEVVVNSGYRFTFDFDDGSREIKPAEQFDLFHVYWAARTYTVSGSVQGPVGRATALTHGDARIVVDSVIVRVDSVSLEVDRDVVEVGSPVTFQMHFRHPNPGLQFRFFFGDGESSSWQAEQTTPHAYSAVGTYWPYAEVGFRQRPFTRSSARQVRVIPEQTPPPDAGLLDLGNRRSEASDTLVIPAATEQGQLPQWLWYFIAALGGVVVMLAVYQLQKWFRAPKMQITLRHDDGGERVKTAGPVGIDVEIRLRSMLGEGKFSIVAEGDSIIQRERGEHG